jgi:putative membrane protein
VLIAGLVLAGIAALIHVNQGFYNLFLALEVALGLALLGARRQAGIGLVAFAAGSMLAAALVLVLSDRTKLRAAAVHAL